MAKCKALTGSAVKGLKDDAMALLVGHRTCDLQVAGSSPGWAPLRSPWASYLHMCVSVTKHYSLVLAKGSDALWLGK